MYLLPISQSNSVKIEVRYWKWYLTLCSRSDFKMSHNMARLRTFTFSIEILLDLPCWLFVCINYYYFFLLLQLSDVVIHYATGQMDRFFDQTIQLKNENLDDLTAT